MLEYSVVSPVSPLKKKPWRSPRSANDDQAVVLRMPGARPEQCCDGAALTCARPPATGALSHQSSSVMRSSAIPHDSRCAPTPKLVKNGTSVLASSKMVG